MENIKVIDANIGKLEGTVDVVDINLGVDEVNHPSHYTWIKDLCGLNEVNDITRHMNFNLGNAIKYILRSGKKPIIDKDLSDNFNKAAIQDLKKAIWYLNDEINRIEKWGL